MHLWCYVSWPHTHTKNVDLPQETKKKLPVRNDTSVVPHVPQLVPPLALALVVLDPQPQLPQPMELQLQDSEDMEPLDTEPDTEPDMEDMEPQADVKAPDAEADAEQADAQEDMAVTEPVDSADSAEPADSEAPEVTEPQLPHLPHHLLLLPQFQDHQVFQELQV